MGRKKINGDTTEVSPEIISSTVGVKVENLEIPKRLEDLSLNELSMYQSFTREILTDLARDLELDATSYPINQNLKQKYDNIRHIRFKINNIIFEKLMKFL